MNEKRALFFALLTVLCWATAATAFKLGLSGMHFVGLLWYAAMFSLLFLLLAAAFSNQLANSLRINLKQLLFSAVAGFLNPFAYYLVLFSAYNRLPAQVAQPLNMLWPISLVLLSALILKKKITGLNLLALLVSFTGVLIISSQGEWFRISKSDPVGVVLATGSSIVWALYWIAGMYDSRNEYQKLIWNFAFGVTYLCIAVVIHPQWAAVENLTNLAPAAWIGAFEMGFAFLFWMKALQYTRLIARVNNLIYLTPFLSIGCIWLVLHEKIYFTTFVGLILILVSVVFQQRWSAKQ